MSEADNVPRGVVGVPLRMIAIASLTMGVGACLGFLPGFIATALRADLGVSNGAIGLLIGVYFGCTGLGSVACGRATERLGARLVIALNMLLVAGAALLAATFASYSALLVASVVAGAGYALVNAGTNVAIGRSVPAARRTVALAVKTAGVPAMAVIASGLGPASAARWGWRPIIFVLGGLAVAMAIAALLTFDDDRPVRRRQPATASAPDGFLWFAAGAFLLVAGSQPLYSWVIPYLEDVLSAGPASAGSVTALASAIGIVTMIVSAFRTDRARASSLVGRLVAMIGVSLVGTAMVLAAERLGIALAVFGTVIGIGAQLSAIATMHALIVDRARGRVATATGVTMTGYYLGALFGPVAFGVVADLSGGYMLSWLTTATALGLAIPVWLRAGLRTRAAEAS